ncbi:MAG: GtrA family protein [Leifsonia xyli]|nr:MAG: GtrA family protein [Leifsonia xyli]
MRKLMAQFARFGAVGLIGLVIDFGVFNLLRATVLSPENLHEGPVFAKIISTALAIIANWIGNRFWTFREHRGRQLWREFVEFLVVSLGGMAIGLGSLWVSHYLLGFTSILADNISGNVIGLALGTAFRFTFYKLWVFAPHRGETGPAVFPGDAELSDDRTPSSRRPVGTAPVVAARRPDSSTAP